MSTSRNAYKGIVYQMETLERCISIEVLWAVGRRATMDLACSAAHADLTQSMSIPFKAAKLKHCLLLCREQLCSHFRPSSRPWLPLKPRVRLSRHSWQLFWQLGTTTRLARQHSITLHSALLCCALLLEPTRPPQQSSHCSAQSKAVMK